MYNAQWKYDKRGNILSLKRWGRTQSGGSGKWQSGMIDDLSYIYATHTNRIEQIVENNKTIRNEAIKNEGFRPGNNTIAKYEHDRNGNIMLDPHKGLRISYNYLNLPYKFDFGKGKIIEILYGADGTKWQKIVKQGNSIISKRDYLSGVEYLDGSPEAAYHEEGRVYFTDNAIRQEYTIRDHLGNSRINFSDLNQNGIVDYPREVLQENQYYPFGMAMNGPWLKSTDKENLYQYNGKELNEEFGLGWYDYGARYYDPSTARWNGVDPLADAPHLILWSPYHYSYNNPVLYVDPDGRSPIRGAVAAYRYVRRAYKIYKKTGKLTPKSLKKAGLDEIGDIAGDLSTIFGSDASLLDRAGAAVDLVVGTDFNNKGNKAVSKTIESVTGTGKRRKNRIPDKGEPNTVSKNKSGTTAKKYGPDGNVQKEYNKGHGKDAPKNEQDDHIHDYKPDPYNPSGRGDRQPGRKPKKGEVVRDFDIKKNN